MVFTFHELKKVTKVPNDEMKLLAVIIARILIIHGQIFL